MIVVFDILSHYCNSAVMCRLCHRREIGVHLVNLASEIFEQNCTYPRRGYFKHYWELIIDGSTIHISQIYTSLVAPIICRGVYDSHTQREDKR